MQGRKDFINVLTTFLLTILQNKMIHYIMALALWMTSMRKMINVQHSKLETHND